MTLPVKATKGAPSPGISRVLGLLDHTEYGPAKWSERAYHNIFEKFNYAEANDEKLDLGLKVLCHEYDYMIGTEVTNLCDVEKNTDSHPGYPSRYLYDTEASLIASEGDEAYIHFRECFRDSEVYPLWYGFLKSETMKRVKIENEDIRLIACAPAQFTRLGATFEQASNSRLKKKTKTRQAQIGWRPMCGGFDQTIRRFDDCDYLMEMDWTRYDGTIPHKVWDCVNRFRVGALSATPADKRLYTKYRKALSNRMTVLPTGDMVLMTKGNPSGQFSTSVDNCMAQTLLTFYETYDWIKHKTGVTPTIEEVFDAHVTISYGDDRLTGYRRNKRFSHCFPPGREWLTNYYKSKFGMWVKPENIIIQAKREGLSFCGMTIAEGNHGYVPVFRAPKLYSALARPSRDVATLEELQAKLTSLAYLTAWDNSYEASEIRRSLKTMQAVDPGFVPLGRDMMRSFWEDQRSFC